MKRHPNLTRFGQPRRARGFTLVELMISLVLGLFLIGGVITVFVSNQQTYRTTTALDNAQEAFRFASHTITRVVRQSSGLIEPGSSNELQVRLDADAGDGVRNCLGAEVDGPENNRFYLVGDALHCEVDAPPGSPVEEDEALVSGLTSLAFEYGVADDAYWLDTSDFRSWDDPAMDWTTDDIRSIRVNMTLAGSGLSSTFIATRRQSAIALSGGGGNGGGGNGGGGNGDDGNGDDGNGDDGNGDDGTGDDGTGDDGTGDDGTGDDGNGDDGNGDDGTGDDGTGDDGNGDDGTGDDGTGDDGNNPWETCPTTKGGTVEQNHNDEYRWKVTDVNNGQVSANCDIDGRGGNATYTCDFTFTGLNSRIAKIEILRNGNVVDNETVRQCEVD